MNDKHAFMIGVYQNPDYIHNLIKSLDGNRSNIYVHVNKHNLDDFRTLKEVYENVPNVMFVDSVPIRWGGLGLLKSMDIMLSEAFQNPDNQFFHFITGQDMLVKPLDYVYKFFDENHNKNYILAHDTDEELNGDLYNQFFKERYERYHFYDVLDYRSRGTQYKIGRLLTKLIHLIGYKRSAPFNQMIRCSSWYSINKEGAKELLNYLHLENGYKRLKYIFAPDEFLIGSLFYNSPNRKKLNIEHTNLRYIAFPKQGGNGSPRTLTLEDFPDILSSEAIFARKIDPIISEDLIKRINETIS